MNGWKTGLSLGLLWLAGACGGATFAGGTLAQTSTPEVGLTSLTEQASYNGQWVRTEGVYQEPHLLVNCPAGTFGIIFLDPHMVDLSGTASLADNGMLIACTDQSQLAWLAQFPPMMVRFRLAGQVSYNADPLVNLGFPAVLLTPTVDMLAPIGIPIPWF